MLLRLSEHDTSALDLTSPLKPGVQESNEVGLKYELILTNQSLLGTSKSITPNFFFDVASSVSFLDTSNFKRSVKTVTSQKTSIPIFPEEGF